MPELNHTANTERLSKLMDDVQALLDVAAKDPSQFKSDPIDWGSLHCVGVCHRLWPDGETDLGIHLSRLSPTSTALPAWLYSKLFSAGLRHFEIICEW